MRKAVCFLVSHDQPDVHSKMYIGDERFACPEMISDVPLAVRLGLARYQLSVWWMPEYTTCPDMRDISLADNANKRATPQGVTTTWQPIHEKTEQGQEGKCATATL